MRVAAKGLAQWRVVESYFWCARDFYLTMMYPFDLLYCKKITRFNSSTIEGRLPCRRFYLCGLSRDVVHAKLVINLFWQLFFCVLRGNQSIPESRLMRHFYTYLMHSLWLFMISLKVVLLKFCTFHNSKNIRTVRLIFIF